MGLNIFRSRKNNERPVPLLKKLFWLYFVLLIFEGALRKWILPQFSAPLLLIRDPVALWIVWEAFRTGKWPRNWSAVIGLLTLAMTGLCVFQMVFNDNPWIAGLYGLRSYLLPFPVAFIMGENLDAEDLRRLAVFTLSILLPLTLVEVIQYLSLPDAWVNAGAYHGAQQIMYAGDHVRASATFSYVVGPIDLVALAAAFLIYGLVNEMLAPKWLLYVSGAAIVLSVPMVGARALIYELGAIVVCVGIAALFGVSQLAKSFKVIVPILLLCVLVSFLPVFSKAMGTLNTRFTSATTSEGGTEQSLIDRVFDPLTGSIEDVDFSHNWIGIGMGRGAAGVTKLLNGTASFMAGESASSREIHELGPFPGCAFMILCYLLGTIIFSKAVARARDHEPLALLLSPAMLITLSMGVFEQPTEQGFMVISMAFCLAALKLPGISVQMESIQSAQLLRLAAIRDRRIVTRNSHPRLRGDGCEPRTEI